MGRMSALLAINDKRSAEMGRICVANKMLQNDRRSRQVNTPLDRFIAAGMFTTEKIYFNHIYHTELYHANSSYPLAPVPSDRILRNAVGME